MAITVTSREFNQRASQILKISETQPVFITKWGKIVGVLSNYASYQQQAQKEQEPSFERLFSGKNDLSDAEFEEFQQELEQIRKKTTFRVCEFEDIE
ncbi:prevent-host-death family protein/antitoxin of toxin-antitoxin stability system [Canicola haemoglobinophilus]|uniref:Prevent-host-death family protein/antitoxin of toxin-antitoxin stability system n=1 Tax=Canicola haemoglobinophilus TaxID=733 RepID=A0AB38HDG6_9PAST|nr:type II toxin-antitoxin system Phd/YefM family antitoxin [Canicola haemoglobinophilus]STO54786.1 prevent-host-death family protein/antitoxin of toxin-antitoxin stability system [Canicola haemoglobinophilus]STO69642.1 prevent-host-death family protein/antitoxin of toxin-antitoxin stability system [Canicola haemoglobinophilus]